MFNKNNCSILIPTFNRPKYLKRIINYYNDYGRKYNVIIADSSSDENKNKNKENILRLSKNNIYYNNKYNTNINPYHKISDALKQIKTKYCVICADDDFITPNGINQSVNFLEKNPDFTVAHGRYISFHLKADKKKRQHFCWNPIYPGKSITFSDAESRLNFHFSNYYPTLYGVHKTEFLRIIFKETLKFTNDVRFAELLPSMITLVYGKMKRLDLPYSARESILDSGGRTIKRMEDFVKDGTYDGKYNKFKNCLSKYLSKKSHLHIEEAKKVVDKGMGIYMKRNKRWIRLLYRRLPFLKPKQMKGFRSSFDKFHSKYYNDFNNIRLHVLKHSKG